jgi:hypothetical protein
MSDERDFSFETEGAARDPSEAEPTPKPIVVIQYRNRGLPRALLPPLLILIAALSIVSYRRQQPLRTLTLAAAERTAAPAPAGQGRLILVEPSGVGFSSEPIIVRSEPSPLPAAAQAGPARSATRTATAAETTRGVPPLPGPETLFEVSAAAGPQPGQPPSPPRAEAEAEAQTAAAPGPAPAGEVQEKRDEAPPQAAGRPAIGFQPPGDSPPAEPQREVTKEQILAGIEREAQQKEADLQNLEEVKPRLQAQEYAELRRQAQENRSLFHNELRRVLDARGNAAARDIDNLCDQYGRTAPPDVHNAVSRLLKKLPARFNRQTKIDLMRSRGLPEPMVLDYLARELHRLAHSSRCPHEEDEFRVRAARLLITYPVQLARKATASTPPVRSTAKPVANVAAPPAAAPNR